MRKGFLYLAIFMSLGLSSCRDHNAKNTRDSRKDMVQIPGGKYRSFSASDDTGTISIAPFLLDAKAVTNAEFLEFVKANPKWAKSKVPKLYADGGYLKRWKDDLTFPAELKNSPVTNVSWHAADAYSKWKGKRLPTLAEWEFVGNARVQGQKQELDKLILNWYGKPTSKVLPAVYSTYRNTYNVYDMHGLVWEWVSDFNSVIMEGKSKSELADKEDLFCDSGSYSAIDEKNYAAFMRFAFRGSLKANYTVHNLGFRCAADIK